MVLKDNNKKEINKPWYAHWWAFVLFVFVAVFLLMSFENNSSQGTANNSSIVNPMNISAILNIASVGDPSGGYLTSIYVNVTNIRETRLNPEFFIEVDNNSGGIICSQRKIPNETNLLNSIPFRYEVSNGELLLEKKCYIGFLGDKGLENYTIEIQLFDANSDKPSLLASDKKKFTCVSFQTLLSGCWILE